MPRRDITKSSDATLIANAKRKLKLRDAPNTELAYTHDITAFETFLEAHDVPPRMPVPNAVIALYLSSMDDADYSLSTIDRALAAICRIHRDAGFESPRKSPEVRGMLKGMKRDRLMLRKRITPRQVDALLNTELAAVVGVLPQTTIGLRDRALILMGFALGCRRSTLVALDVEDITPGRNGWLNVNVRHFKTQSEDDPQIPRGASELTCPVRAYREWLRVSGITTGAVFRGVHGPTISEHRLAPIDVARILARTVRIANMMGRYAGHSLRAGLATSAALAGKPEWQIAQKTGHKSVAQLRKYIRKAGKIGSDVADGLY